MLGIVVAHLGIEEFIGIAALVVEIHHVAQRLETAVVHVRRGLGDIAQSRRLECAPVLGIFRDGVTAHIRIRFVRSNAQVVIGIFGEIRAFVAFVALGFLEVDILAANLCRRQCFLVTGFVAIVGGIAG